MSRIRDLYHHTQRVVSHDEGGTSGNNARTRERIPARVPISSLVNSPARNNVVDQTILHDQP